MPDVAHDKPLGTWQPGLVAALQYYAGESILDAMYCPEAAVARGSPPEIDYRYLGRYFSAPEPSTPLARTARRRGHHGRRDPGGAVARDAPLRVCHRKVARAAAISGASGLQRDEADRDRSKHRLAA